MRPKLLTSWLVPVLLLSPLACVSTDGDGSASAPAADAQPAEAGDKADKKADKPAAKSNGGGDKAAAAKKAGEKKGDKDEEKEKKDKAQKKWDEALKDLEKSTGLFTMHHGEQKLLLELDKKALGREFLYYGALNSGAGSGSIYRGAMLYDNPNVLHFAKRGKKKVILAAENTNFMPGEDPRESRMLDEVLSKGIVNSFDIVAELEDEGRILVDLGGWFMKDNLKLARSMGKVAPNKDLSLVSAVKAFPRNVEVHIDLVFTGEARGNSVLADSRSVELAVQHSFVALPEPGYKPRKFDQRVGYFYTERKNLFDRQADDNVHRYINRWRLTKKDPTAEVSDPVEPIVYWIENSTPKAYRQSIREGIEAWEPAFRKAGFSNAIIAKQMPDDATWDAADVDYAVIRWSGDENVGFAIGPSRQDPRTGETFDADITMQANFLNTYAQRFKTYIEKRTTMSKEDILAEWREAQKPFDAEQHRDPRAMCQMMGEEFALQVAYAAMLLDVVAPEKTEQEFLQDMIREVSAHEVGHTIGLRHNFKSSTLHDLDDLWNAETTMKEGVAGSFMDYPAVLIAHPDKTQGEFFQSVVGPYDYWAIEYGYTEFGSNEDAHLETIASRSNEPGLEYGTDEDSFIGDPYTVVWDMGKNPVAFAEQQLELAEWGLSQMMERAAESGDGFHKYARYYSMFYSMYARNHFGLDRFIGGYTFNRDLVGQDGGRAPIVAIDPALQKQALDVMIDKGLTWSGGIPDEQRLLLANRKYGSFGSWFDFWSFDPLPRIVNSARFSSLLPLMNPSMMERLQAQNILVPDSVTPREVATRVFQTVWVDTPDEHDLWLQVDYVDLAISGLERDSPPQIKALLDGLVRQSKAQLDTYAANADPTIAAHGRWLGDRIMRYRERSKVEF